MLSTIFILFLFASTLLGESIGQSDPVRNWAVLVAGSNGFYNYRHQADVAHAYHILLNNGVPKENIIVMMYDDVACSPENPVNGTLYNDYSHTDYYAGLHVDYKGKEVTPKNFLDVIKGSKELKDKGKKVVDSNANDNIFIYFTDHGAQGIVAFPSSELAADDLIAALNYMYRNNRYNQLVFYIEACESGSMFKGLLSSNMRIYATTASNDVESSYACYCDDRLVHTCLGDSYSVNWMHDTEKFYDHNQTLGAQYTAVKKATNMSHVQEFGDMKMKPLFLSLFQGHKKSLTSKHYTSPKQNPLHGFVGKDARLVHLIPLLKKMKAAGSIEQWRFAERKFRNAMKDIRGVQETFSEIVETLTGSSAINRAVVQHTRAPLTQMSCYKSAYKSFFKHCYKIQQVPEVAFHLYKLNTLCFLNYEAETIAAVIEMVCAFRK